MFDTRVAETTFLVVRDHPHQQVGALPHASPSMSNIISGFRSVFGSSRFWCLAPLAFASYGAMIAVIGLWGGPYLMHTCGLSKTTASVILLATPIGAICGAPFWGRLSDKLRRRKLLILLVQGASLLVFFSLAMDLQLPRWGLLLQFWLFGFTGVSSTLLYVQVKETFPLFIAGKKLCLDPGGGYTLVCGICYTRETENIWRQIPKISCLPISISTAMFHVKHCWPFRVGMGNKAKATLIVYGMNLFSRASLHLAHHNIK